MRIDKRIPAGGGLGGGSADAAAVLRWAGVDDPAIAVRLGADVPFCVRGGRARVTGVGEILEPLAPEPRVFTLVLPPFGCSTAAVYRAWDELGGPTGPGGNDLEPAALAVEPRLAAWRDRLGDATGEQPHLAGSGSTWFVEGEFPGDGRIVVRDRWEGAERRRSGRLLLAGSALPACALEHLLVLLLAHALAPLLDQRTHEGNEATGRRPLRRTRRTRAVNRSIRLLIDVEAGGPERLVADVDAEAARPARRRRPGRWPTAGRRSPRRNRSGSAV